MGLGDYFNLPRLLRTAALFALGMLAIYIEAAPFGLGAAALPSPDLLLCVVCFWAARRPGSTPMVLIFALGLVRDLLTDVPVGAGVLALVLVSEVVKGWRHHLARAGFALEWTAFAAVAIAASAIPWVLVILTFAQPPYLIDLGYQIAHTVLVYPLVVLILRWLLGISWRKPELAT
ncbi:MAG: hypothetical protein AAF409_08640 [Pseudomonadota bacterium]